MSPEGQNWVEETAHRLAAELGFAIELLEWETDWEHKSSSWNPLEPRLAVEVNGVRKVRRLWEPDIDDAPKTLEVRVKLERLLRQFLFKSFGQSSSKIGFGHPKQP